MTTKAFFRCLTEWIQGKHAVIKIFFYPHVRRHPAGLRMARSSGWMVGIVSDYGGDHNAEKKTFPNIDPKKYIPALSVVYRIQWGVSIKITQVNRRNICAICRSRLLYHFQHVLFSFQYNKIVHPLQV